MRWAGLDSTPYSEMLLSAPGVANLFAGSARSVEREIPECGREAQLASPAEPTVAEVVLAVLGPPGGVTVEIFVAVWAVPPQLAETMAREGAAREAPPHGPLTSQLLLTSEG